MNLRVLPLFGAASALLAADYRKHLKNVPSDYIYLYTVMIFLCVSDLENLFPFLNEIAVEKAPIGHRSGKTQKLKK